MRNPAGGMTLRRLTAAFVGLSLGLALGACSSTSGYVSDHWPHWAGGMPEGVPPRPGAPGYDEFIAHQQAAQDAARPAVTGATPTAPQPAPGAAPPPSDAAVARGGLY
jgi:hypothetical protein